MKKHMARKLLILLFCIAMISACTNTKGQGGANKNQPSNQETQAAAGQSTAEPSNEAQEIEHLRIGTNAFTAGLEPTRTSNADAQLQYNIYDTLILRDPFSKSLEFLPGLAESWGNIEPTVWEFKLRQNVKFHDGTIMDAEDVAYSLNRIFKQEDPRFDNAYGRYFNTFDKVEIVDETTVRIHTLQADPLVEIFLSDLSGAITSKEYIDRVGLEQADLMPIGTGPYKVASFVPKENAVLERFEDYWGKKAPIKKVTYTYIPEISSRVTAIANNEIDFVVGIPPEQEATLANQQNVKLLEAAYPLLHVLVLNMNNEVMKNKKLRQALDLAVDREALVSALWDNKGIVPTSLQFPDYGDMYLSDVQTVEYNVEKAKQLVKESGYDGTPVEVTIRTDYYTHGDLAVQAMIEMWKEIGVNATLRQVPDVNAFEDSTIMIRSWSNPLYYPDPMGLIDASWSDNVWVSTRGFWDPQTEEWDKNMEIARFSMDNAERKAALRKLQEITKDEAGFILMYQPFEYFATSSNLEWKMPKNYRAYTISLRAGEIALTN
ncbi:hypothetical protein BK133_28020 [Paenibacillus sp. FSL H8-0548]|uniref:ABC transporter substrate-binding protein n=1 Tax=Paenibacillus sp. FSL H8-0548 TaxID=1920422 RepID=UPI00096DE810|nr:ABC transporter substrate-binding protein [Paenibacillus sp. FSL H8-0548]OMF21644.1 hypothetical protein BK133_28020 [Paenibacillus sp. FSL H8-0548]